MTYSQFLKVTRPLAVATVAGAALFAMPAMAQTKEQAAKPPAADAATSQKPETVEQRITTLKTALKITPDQEKKWDGVAQAMRENASRMEKLVAEKRKIPPDKTTAVDDLRTIPGVHRGPSRRPEASDLGLQVALRFDDAGAEEERRPGLRALHAGAGQAGLTRGGNHDDP